MARRMQIDVMIESYKEGLTRLGFEYLEALFRAYDVKVVAAFQD